MNKAKDRKNALDSLFGGGGMASMVAQGSAQRPRLSSGAIGAAEINLIKDERDRLRTEVDDLTTKLSSSVNVVELDTATVQPSFVADRMIVEHDPDFEALKASIAETGQQVPILVRPAPSEPGQYQIAYGHRRWRACRDLGFSVRGVIKDLTDEELLIAQGQENHERKNLSFIETCLFVHRLAQDYPQALIVKAIGKDKSLVSKYRKLADTIPEDLLRSIGPAPKIGRPRWEDMQKFFDAGRTLEPFGAVIEQIISSDAFKASTSDDRFTLLLTALVEARGEEEAEEQVDESIPVVADSSQPEAEEHISPKPVSSVDTQWLGEKQIKVLRKGTALTLNIDASAHPGLDAFVMERLPQLLEEFSSLSGRKSR